MEELISDLKKLQIRKSRYHSTRLSPYCGPLEYRDIYLETKIEIDRYNRIVVDIGRLSCYLASIRIFF